MIAGKLYLPAVQRSVSDHGAFLQQLEAEALVGAPEATDLADVETKINFVSDLWRKMSTTGGTPAESEASKNEAADYALAVSSTLIAIDMLNENREKIVERIRGLEVEVKSFGPAEKHDSNEEGNLFWMRIPIVSMFFAIIVTMLYCFARDALYKAKIAAKERWSVAVD